MKAVAIEPIATEDFPVLAVDLRKERWAPLLRKWRGATQRLETHCRNIKAVAENEAELTEMRAQVRGERKYADGIRLKASKPLRDGVALLNGQFKKIDEELGEAERHLNLSIRVLINLKEERIAEDRRVREEKHRETMKDLKEDVLSNIGQSEADAEPSRDLIPAEQEEAVAVSSPLAKTEERVMLVPEIVDLAKLPRKYLVPDRAKIKTDSRNGIVIPGVVVREQSYLHTTRQR